MTGHRTKKAKSDKYPAKFKFCASLHIISWHALINYFLAHLPVGYLCLKVKLLHVEKATFCYPPEFVVSKRLDGFYPGWFYAHTAKKTHVEDLQEHKNLYYRNHRWKINEDNDEGRDEDTAGLLMQ